MPPKARVCYICGRQYMLHSFGIHEAQCRELFIKREELKPVKERRPCPSDPMAQMAYGNVDGKSGQKISTKQLDALNSAAQQQWSQEVLMECQHCNRRFLPEKLPIHQRSCTASNPSRRVTEPIARGRDYSSEGTGRLGGTGSQGISSYDMQYADDPSSSSSAFLSGGGGAPIMGLNICPTCGRRFNDIAFEKHSRICSKVFVKKRKPYDSAKHRKLGTELENFRPQPRRKGASLGSSSTRASNDMYASSSLSSGTMGYGGNGNTAALGGGSANVLPKWKQDSLAFRQAMKAAKQVAQAEKQSKETGIPLHKLLPATGASMLSAPNVDPSFIQCPSCGRSFNQQAGERHIPQCKNILSKPKHYTRFAASSSASSSSARNSSISSQGMSMTSMPTSGHGGATFTNIAPSGRKTNSSDVPRTSSKGQWSVAGDVEDFVVPTTTSKKYSRPGGRSEWQDVCTDEPFIQPERQANSRFGGNPNSALSTTLAANHKQTSEFEQRDVRRFGNASRTLTENQYNRRSSYDSTSNGSLQSLVSEIQSIDRGNTNKVVGSIGETLRRSSRDATIYRTNSGGRNVSGGRQSEGNSPWESIPKEARRMADSTSTVRTSSIRPSETTASNRGSTRVRASNDSAGVAGLLGGGSYSTAPMRR